MNLFKKYGIKEVADVTFYSITSIGDEIIYTPVLFLDTLKVSTVEKTGQKVSAEGGKGNKKLVSWNFGKEISLNFEDALFSPASMSMMLSGRLKGKFSIYTSALVKCNIANKYGAFNYSTKAYPSPALSDEEWEVVFKAAQETSEDKYIYTNKSEADADVAENRVTLKKTYISRILTDKNHKAMSETILLKVMSYIDSLNKIGTIDTNLHDVEVLDRFERCTVRDKEGFKISTQEQRDNLFRYYANDKSSSYTIYYDVKTMLPLLHLQDNQIQGWTGEDVNFTLKPGTGYLKWTRTVKRVNGDGDSSLGNVLVIDAETFSGDYKIVGETYIRDQKTGKDQRYQITVNRAQVNSDTNITLQADGDPTTFSMQIDVLSPQNGDLMELKQFNVEDDLVYGGTRVVAQSNQLTHSNTLPITNSTKPDDINNVEIY